MAEKRKHEAGVDQADKANLKAERSSVFSSAKTLEEADKKAEEAGIEGGREVLETHILDLVGDAERMIVKVRMLKKQMEASQLEGALEVSDEVVKLKRSIERNSEEMSTEKDPFARLAREIARLEVMVQEFKKDLQEKEIEQPTGWLKLNPFGNGKRKEFEEEKKSYIKSTHHLIREAEKKLEAANRSRIGREKEKMELVGFKKQLEELRASSDAAKRAEQRLDQDVVALNAEADKLRSELVHVDLLLAFGTVESPEAKEVQKGLQKKDLRSLVDGIESYLQELKERSEMKE